MGRKWLWMVLWLGGGMASGLAGEGAPPARPPDKPLVPQGPVQATSVQPAPSPTDALDAAPDEAPTHVVKVLRTTNKAQTNRYVIKVYDFKNQNPAEVHRFWRRMAEIEESGHFTFLGPDGKSGKLVMIIPEYQVPYVDGLVAAIDRPGLTTSSGTEGMIYRLKHRSAADAEFIKTVNEYLTPSGTEETTLDTETNTILFYDALSGLESATEALGILDTPVPLVRLDVTIYEIYGANDGRLGLDFHAWKNGPGRDLFSYGAFRERQRTSSSVSGIPAPTPNTPINIGTGVGLTEFTAHGTNSSCFLDVPSAYFDFVATKGKGQVRARGSVAVNHARTATFQTGDTILYYHVMDATPGMAGASPGPKDLSVNANAIAASPKGGYRTDLIDPTSGNSSKVPKNRTLIARVADRKTLGGSLMSATDTGVYVNITPTVGTDSISMEVTTQVVNHVAYADNGVPLVVERKASTKVQAADGQEIVLGGLVYETPINAANKVPVLGSLPVLGYLFGGETKQANKRLVVVAIKATKLTTSGVMPEDADTMEKAKGNKAIHLPGVKAKLCGDPINP